MKRRTFLLGLPAVVGCSGGRQRLNVLNFSEYVAPDTIPNFEAESGVRVRYAVAESNEEILARVMSGNSGWDVVFVSHNRIRPMQEYSLLARIERARLANLHNLDPRFQSPPWDPGLEWSIPYMWGTSGILYNRRLVTAPPARWADLWDTRFQGRLTMLDDAEEVFGASMKKLGFSYVSPDPEQMRLAQREEIRQKPLLRAYLNSEARDQVVAGDILVAQALATTAAQAMDASPDATFVYPEGFGIYADNAVILRESRRVEMAHTFIDYLLRPRVAAKIVEVSKTATPNAAAQALLPPALRNHPALYPAPDVFARGEWLGTLAPAAQRLRDRLWTEIKAA